MNLTLKSNALQFARALLDKTNALPRVGSETVNTAAKVVETNYKRELNKFILRNKFTKGSIKLQTSKPMSSKGGARALSNINATIGVMKMKGGKDHFLKIQEEGGTKIGKLNGRVAIPLNSARTSESKSKPIAGPLRLQNSKPQVLKLAGEPFGVGDRFSPAQRWGILHKYSSKPGMGRYGWDLSKQFLFEGIKKGLGSFIFKKNRITMVRTLKKSSVTIRATHKFEKSVDKMTPTMFEAIFKRAASKYLKG